MKHKGRNKYQLIALFRYWAMKGIDQFTLSKMKKNTTRRDICRYLNQIRLIIYNDFVPHFLGACSRGRDFFLQQNTTVAKELYNMKDDDLAAVCDGGYIYIEKSQNNTFQKATFSTQKKSNLIKPMALTCTNGYIIDMYGPFEGKWNDILAFREVLKDRDLLDILIPKKTIIVVDRGDFKFYKSSDT